MKDDQKGLVPRLRFPEFRGAGEWRPQKMGQHLTESRVKGSKGDVAKKLTVKLWGNGVYEKQENTKGSVNTQYYQRQAGQFVYSKLDFLNQAFGIIPKHLDNYESTVDLPCFDANESLDVKFLLEYVQRKDFYKRYGEIADGGRKAKRIQVETFLNFPILLPQIEEQQKIADCLSSLDALIAAQVDKLEALKTHKKGLMQQLFPREGETVPRLRFPEFRQAEEWEEVELGGVIEIASGQVDPTNPPYCDFPHVGGENIESNTGMIQDVRTAKELRLISGKYAFDESYILYSKIRPALNKVARPNFKGICSADIYPIRPSESDLILDYLFYILLSERFLKYAKQHSDRGKIPKVNREALFAYTLSIPLPAEQRRIVDCLSSLDTLIATQTEKLAALKDHKKGLMQQLFPSPEVTP